MRRTRPHRGTKGLAARTGLRSRTVLERHVPLAQVSTRRTERGSAALHPVRSNAAGPKLTGPDRTTVDAVLERDQHSCIVCGLGLCGERGLDWSIHHRKRRSQGGDNSPANLISVCGHGTAGCHGAIHATPGWARDFGGWLVKGSEDPARVRVLVEAGSHWVYLTADARYSDGIPEVGA